MAIAAGTPSFELMLRAGTAAAACVLRDFPDRLSHGVALFVGSGNNGGDAYIVAGTRDLDACILKCQVLDDECP